MTVAVGADPRYRLTEQLARELAATYETPLYVIDESHLRLRIRRYQEAFRAVWPNSELSYASKANSTLAVLAIAHQEGCVIDVASEGELRAALAAGVPASHCHLHGNNKSVREIEFSLESGIAHIIVDNFKEISDIASLLKAQRSTLNASFVLRLAPGVDPITHHKISTGQADTKFGFNIADGSAEKALTQCLELGLPVIGFHCHVGSQLLDPEAQQVGGELIAKFAVDMKARHDFTTTYINVGGGLGVKYLDEHEPMPVEDYCRLITDSVRSALAGSGLKPVLGQEPGRALIAESGLTLYTVGAVKDVPSPTRGTRTYVTVDGGLADNPRPVMYGAKYAVERIARESELTSKPESKPPHAGRTSEMVKVERPPSGGSDISTVTISGRHCETDMLFEDVQLPPDTGPGDLLQVLCTGAYNSVMASNYNRYQRPKTALIRADGSHQLVQRSETWDEMLAREILPKDLKG
jgi:diaminopimelate decarboxylase